MLLFRAFVYAKICEYIAEAFRYDDILASLSQYSDMYTSLRGQPAWEIPSGFLTPALAE